MGEYYGNKVAGTVFREIADKVMATDIDLSLQKDILALTDGQQYYPVPGPGDYEYIKTVVRELNLPADVNGRINSYAQVDLANNKIQIEELAWREGTVPDVTGMGLRDAVPLLENNGYVVKIEGQGRVISQSVDPGSEVPHGTIIYLNLGGLL
jgi:cell division protein FtsI (penicillin-binding protein 3)